MRNSAAPGAVFITSLKYSSPVININTLQSPVCLRLWVTLVGFPRTYQSYKFKADRVMMSLLNARHYELSNTRWKSHSWLIASVREYISIFPFAPVSSCIQVPLLHLFNTLALVSAVAPIARSVFTHVLVSCLNLVLAALSPYSAYRM